MLSLNKNSRGVHEALLARNLTIATAESLTAGMVASTLADNSGSSKYLLGGVVAYTLDVKADVLGVNKDMARACNCVSAEVASEMANGVVCLLNSNIGVATTGYAETDDPDGPYAYIAVAFHGSTTQQKVNGPGLNRNQMRQKVVDAALELVLLCLAAD